MDILENNNNVIKKFKKENENNQIISILKDNIDKYLNNLLNIFKDFLKIQMKMIKNEIKEEKKK